MRSVCARKGTICIVVMAFMLAGAKGAAAQSVAEAGTWTATPFVGVSFGTSNSLDNSLGLGVAVGYDLTSNLGFEGELGHVFDVVGDNDNVDWSITNISANALYHFDVRGGVTPYATFGLGWERSGIHVDVPDPVALYPGSTTEIAYNFGGGVKYKMTDRLLARADVRRFQANDLAPNHWRVYGGLTFTLAKR